MLHYQLRIVLLKSSNSVYVLTNALLNEWANIPTVIIQNLVENLQRRVEAVIAAKGDQFQINVLSLFWNNKTQNTLSGPKPGLREKEPGSLLHSQSEWPGKWTNKSIIIQFIRIFLILLLFYYHKMIM